LQLKCVQAAPSPFYPCNRRNEQSDCDSDPIDTIFDHATFPLGRVLKAEYNQFEVAQSEGSPRRVFAKAEGMHWRNYEKLRRAR